MNSENFDKLKAIYTQLIELVCYAKETDSEDENMDCFFKMFQLVRACLNFSPYTHFYTQVLIDIIVKTYNTKTFRTDLLYKSQIGVHIDNSKYYSSEIFEEFEEDEYTTQILLLKWVEKIVNIIKEKHIVAEEVYELQNTEEQIRFELFKVIQNNFVINKCENCGRLFIPTTTSNNTNQKGRNDQKYCNNLFEDTGKTCKEIGALNKQKEKVQNSPILREYQREYKRMHGLHYNHMDKFTEAKFKEWSKKAKKLRSKYIDKQIDEFKTELKKLSDLYWK